MAEILTGAKFDPTSHLSRVMRAQKLEGYEEYQWYQKLLLEEEKTLVDHTQSILSTSCERDQAVWMLAGFRKALRFVREDREAAEKLLKEENRQEDPTTPKRRPVL